MKTKHLLLIGLMLASSMLRAAEPTLTEQAQLRIDSLNNLITTANGMGLEVQRERMTVRVAEIFLKYAELDEYRVIANTNYFKLVPRYEANAAEMATLLPDFQRTEVVLMLTKAIGEIKSLMAGDIVRQPTTIIDWERLDIEGNQVVLDGKPVFLSDYVWKPKTEELMEYFGQLDGSYISPAYVENASGTIRASVVADLTSKPSGKFGSIFFDHQEGMPQWALTKYPGLYTGGRTYTRYDIDNAGARELQRLLLKTTIPLMAGKNYSKMGYMLCNEPGWHTAVGSHDTGTISDSTRVKFRAWLKDRHQSINTLNTLWGTSFSSFDNVNVTIPMPTNLRGNAQWYDWMTFNMVRSTSWFQFIHDEIMKYDPNGRTHIKVMPAYWGYSDYDNGLDMEALMGMCEILGNDCGTATVRRNGTPASDRYAFAWREMCPFYDFCRSVDPDKMMVNSETHFLSGFDFRDLYLTAEYTRAVTWLAAMHGLNVSQTWVWGRTADGSINSSTGEGYAGSIIQQPRVMNELEATTMDLNRFPEHIAAMQNLRKPLRIFYSKTSAINSGTYMNNLFSVYEALAFNGVPLGYVTENILKTHDNSNWDCVVIYQTPSVTQAERNAVQEYIANGGIVIIDGESFKRDEYGRSLSALTAAGQGQLISATSMIYLTYQATQRLTNAGALSDITLTETNSLNQKGCIWRAIKMDNGKHILSVVNTGKTIAKLDISVKTAPNGIVCRDLLTGKTRSSKPELQPNEVFFVEISDADESAIANPAKQQELAKLYPTYVDDILNIYMSDWGSVEMSIYNMGGSLVKKERYAYVKNISEPVDTLANGVYLVKLTSKEQSQTLSFVKK